MLQKTSHHFLTSYLGMSLGSAWDPLMILKTRAGNCVLWVCLGLVWVQSEPISKPTYIHGHMMLQVLSFLSFLPVEEEFFLHVHITAGWHGHFLLAVQWQGSLRILKNRAES